MLEVLFDQERRDWHSVFGYVRHDLEAGISISLSEIRECKDLVLKGEYTTQDIEQRFAAIEGGLHYQVSQHTALESYARVVSSRTSSLQGLQSDMPGSTSEPKTCHLRSFLEPIQYRSLLVGRYHILTRFGQYDATWEHEVNIPEDLEAVSKNLHVLQHVLQELLINAHKHAPENSSIRIEAEEVVETLILRVSNRARSLTRAEDQQSCVCNNCHRSHSVDVVRREMSTVLCSNCAKAWLLNQFSLPFSGEKTGSNQGLGFARMKLVASKALGAVITADAEYIQNDLYPFRVSTTVQLPQRHPVK